MITRFITFLLFTQIRCKFWTRVQRNIAGSRENSRILTKRSLYRHFYPQCRYEPMPRIRRNDNARLLYIRRMFLIYDESFFILLVIQNYCTLQKIIIKFLTYCDEELLIILDKNLFILRLET